VRTGWDSTSIAAADAAFWVRVIPDDHVPNVRTEPSLSRASAGGGRRPSQRTPDQFRRWPAGRCANLVLLGEDEIERAALRLLG
jgi:hypothetical protein